MTDKQILGLFENLHELIKLNNSMILNLEKRIKELELKQVQG
jgi:hypothetical protein